jgi:hypothetical protein
MCACEPGWTCPKCEGTPGDHRYELDEPEPVAEVFAESDA